MARMDTDIRSFADAAIFIAGGERWTEMTEREAINAQGRKLGHNTWVNVGATIGTEIQTIHVRYHRTDIVTYHRDLRVTLNTGGWMTSTTKQRLNAVTPFGVYSDGPDCWAVITPGPTWDTPHDSARFSDGMTSDPLTGYTWQDHKAARFAAWKAGR